MDWSGAVRGRLATCVLDASSGRVEVAQWKNRGEVLTFLLRTVFDLCPSGECLLGFDFCFSFPFWFLGHLGLSSAPEAWERVRDEGEGWARFLPFPFFGPQGSRPPEGVPLFRLTEELVRRSGQGRPQSVFKLAGAGAVGMASLTGMPALLSLRAAGVRVWPFDPPGEVTAVEIYPRLFQKRLRKGDPSARASFVLALGLEGDALEPAVASEDVFDALVAAVGMARAGFLRLLGYGEEFRTSPLVQAEGWIFPVGDPGPAHRGLGADPMGSVRVGAEK